MELFLGMAGLAGLAGLVQTKALPSEKDFLAAMNTLNFKPDDASANLVAGKYKTFVENDFQFGLPYLAKSSDKVLQTLAQKEMDEAKLALPEQKVGMGDEWVIAAKKYPAISRSFYDHASDWYAQAWPQLDALWKAKVKEQGMKLATPRPPGPARKGFPKAWVQSNPADKFQPVLDGAVAYNGSYSMKLGPKDAKLPELIFYSDNVPVAGVRTVELSARAMSDATENPQDQIFFQIFDQQGTGVGSFGTLATPDLPVWRRLVVNKDLPANIAFIRVGAAKRSNNGTLWVDDFSVKLDGKEVLKNGSFEER